MYTRYMSRRLFFVLFQSKISCNKDFFELDIVIFYNYIY